MSLGKATPRSRSTRLKNVASFARSRGDAAAAADAEGGATAAAGVAAILCAAAAAAAAACEKKALIQCIILVKYSVKYDNMNIKLTDAARSCSAAALSAAWPPLLFSTRALAPPALPLAALAAASLPSAPLRGRHCTSISFRAT